MDQITIEIPEGLPAEQREELVKWLEKKAADAVPKREAFENEPAWQQETARRLQEAIEQADAGRVLTSLECRRRLDTKLGIDRGL